VVEVEVTIFEVKGEGEEAVKLDFYE
jgi:hypothetical protein